MATTQPSERIVSSADLADGVAAAIKAADFNPPFTVARRRFVPIIDRSKMGEVGTYECFVVPGVETRTRIAKRVVRVQPTVRCAILGACVAPEADPEKFDEAVRVFEALCGQVQNHLLSLGAIDIPGDRGGTAGIVDTTQEAPFSRENAINDHVLYAVIDVRLSLTESIKTH